MGAMQVEAAAEGRKLGKARLWMVEVGTVRVMAAAVEVEQKVLGGFERALVVQPLHCEVNTC